MSENEKIRVLEMALLYLSKEVEKRCFSTDDMGSRGIMQDAIEIAKRKLLIDSGGV